MPHNPCGRKLIAKTYPKHSGGTSTVYLCPRCDGQQAAQ